MNVVIQLKNEQVACTKQIDAEDADQNAIKTSFTVHKSGSYKISIMVSGRHVKGSPFTKTFEPGEKCFKDLSIFLVFADNHIPQIHILYKNKF